MAVCFVAGGRRMVLPQRGEMEPGYYFGVDHVGAGRIMEARTVALCVVLNSENIEVRLLRYALSEWRDSGLLAGQMEQVQ